MIKTDGGKWMFTPCQLSTQRHCLVCRDGIKKTWRAAFKILDYRGTWDKDRKKFKHDEKIEKVWYVGSGLTEQIQALADKRGKPLSEIVVEVTRSGKGKSSTYNLEQAWDAETDKRVVPAKHKEVFAPIEEICKPLTDDKLEAIGFSAGDDDE